ncbi:hypothetical protein Tco_1129849 [Tanacetum coccineum]
MAADRGFVHLEELMLLANSTKLRDQLLVYFDMKTQRESQLATELNNLTRNLRVYRRMIDQGDGDEEGSFKVAPSGPQGA